MPEIERTHPDYVPGSGDPAAPIVVLGEAPGKNEEIKKIPFIGASGKLLFNDILAQAMISRTDCFADNVSPVRPPGDVFSSVKRLGVDIPNLMLECFDKIHKHPRKMIICCGNAALEAMTGKKGIMNYRGSYLRSHHPERPFFKDGYPVIPMIHPAATLREWKLLYPTRHDAKRAKFHFDNPEFDTPPREIYTKRQRIVKTLKTREVYPEPHTSDFFIEELSKMQRASILSYDIETYAETITVFGIADTPYHALSIPFTGEYSAVEEARLIEAIRSLLSSPIPKVAQNGVYDNTYLANNWGIEVKGYCWDTMLMHHNCYAELPHSLAFLCSIYTHEPFYKLMAKEADDASYEDAHWEYNALDCAITLEALEGLQRDMKSLGVEPFYWDHYLPLTYALGRVQNRGIPLDKEEHNRMLSETDKQLVVRKSRMAELVGGPLNINSPKQLKVYLYENLGLPPQYNRGSNQITTNEDALLNLRKRHPPHQEFLDTILELRSLTKTKSTYLVPKAGLEDPDGRVRTSYNIAGSARKAQATGGTETGRLSSSTNAYGRGGNLQNIPKWLRSMYGTSEDGWVFWQADLSSAESYVVAWDSGEPSMLEILQRHSLYGQDGTKIWYHEFIGHILTGLPLEDIKGDFRDLAKTVGHGWNYGMGTKKMVEIVNLRMPSFPFDHSTAKECFHALDTSLSAVTRWRETIREKIRQTRRLRNCFGRQRLFLGRFDESTYREGFAFVPQSEVGDWLNKCLVETERVLGDRSDFELLGQVHDSIFGQVREESLEEIQRTIVDILQRPLPRHVGGVQLRIPCEWKDGENWKEAS
jgi:DNA polymerase-1